MKGRFISVSVGMFMLLLGGSRVSMLVGLSGLSSSWFAIFAIGIVVVASAPIRQLSERVRSLEVQLAQARSEGQLAHNGPAA